MSRSVFWGVRVEGESCMQSVEKLAERARKMSADDAGV